MRTYKAVCMQRAIQRRTHSNVSFGAFLSNTFRLIRKDCTANSSYAS